MKHNNGGLFAIYDTVAQTIVGGLYAISIHKHAASAVRMFTDLATNEGNDVNRHPADYELHQLGWLDDENNLIPDRNTVLTGKAWLATLTPTEPKLVKENA